MTEERLQQAAKQAGRAIVETLPAPEECPHTFSLDFQRKMKRLLRREKHPLARPALRAACMLLVCLLGCGTFFQVNAEAREIFLGWVSRLEEGAQHYFFSGIYAEEDNPVQYSLPEIPEGFEEVSIEITEHKANMLYQNDEGFYFEFGYLKQDTISSSSDSDFLVGDIEAQTVYVNGSAADLYIDESGSGGNLIVWIDQEENVLLHIDAPLGADDLICLAESVQRIS